MTIKVHLVPPERVFQGVHHYLSGCYHRIMECASQTLASEHSTEPALIDDPDQADLVIFPIQGGECGPCFERLRSCQFYRKYSRRSVVYSTNDLQYPAVPGLYPGLPSRWHRPGWAVTAHYLTTWIQDPNYSLDEIANKDILYSFVGSSQTHPFRRRLVAMNHPRGVISDATPPSDARYWWQKEDKEQMEARYRDITRRSKFVLCPRGVSPLSCRFFHAMAAAAVPVLIADDAVLPAGPDWSRCIVQVPESDIPAIPKLLSTLEPQSNEMGAAARRNWEEFFSPRASLRYLCNLGLQVVPNSQSGVRRVVQKLGVRATEFATFSVVRGKARYRLRGT